MGTYYFLLYTRTVCQCDATYFLRTEGAMASALGERYRYNESARPLAGDPVACALLADDGQAFVIASDGHTYPVRAAGQKCRCGAVLQMPAEADPAAAVLAEIRALFQDEENQHDSRP